MNHFYPDDDYVLSSIFFYFLTISTKNSFLFKSVIIILYDTLGCKVEKLKRKRISFEHNRWRDNGLDCTAPSKRAIT